MYRIVFTEDAQKDLQMLQKKAPQAIKKVEVLVGRTAGTPTDGYWTGGIVETLQGRNLVKAYKQGTPFGVSHS